MGTCIKCNKLKTEDEMCTRNTCFDCKNEYTRNYRKKNKEKFKLYEEKRGKDPERIKYKKEYKQNPINKRRHAACERVRRRTPGEQILSRAKNRAKKLNLPFNITIDDIIIPEFCPILGLKLEISECGFSDSSISLDRIIPEFGYVKGNVVVISNRANVIKRDASLDELEKIYHFYKNLSNIS